MNKNFALTKQALRLTGLLLCLVPSIAKAQVNLNDVDFWVKPGAPPAAPAVVAISQTDKNKATVKFLVDLGVQKPDGTEDPAPGVGNQTYYISVVDGFIESESDITISEPGFTISLMNANHAAVLTKTGGNSKANFTVSAKVYFPDVSIAPNDKTVTMDGTASVLAVGGLFQQKTTDIPAAVVSLTAVKVTLENPLGDPTLNTARVEVNEFTYDELTPGVCKIECRAKLEPDTPETTIWAESNVWWSTTADGKGVTKWESKHTDGLTYNSNRGKNVNCKLTGLPDTNSGFGLKTVTLKWAGYTTTTNIEVFFNRDASNHPGGNQTPPGTGKLRSPNWFYYWNLELGGTNVLYDSSIIATIANGAGQVPAMMKWSPTMTHPKTEIWIHRFQTGKYQRRNEDVATAQWVSGIDYFANVLAHEKKHVKQIADADRLLTENGKPGDWFKGWSWNREDNNHRNPNLPAKPIELDFIKDDWPDQWMLPANPTGAPLWTEADARLAEDIDEDTNQAKDWGDNGKQHKTNGKWDD